MNFKYSLYMEIFLIWHEVMFIMCDEDFPTCKLSKSGNPTGEGRWGGLTLIISVDEGGGG